MIIHFHVFNVHLIAEPTLVPMLVRVVVDN